MKRLLLSTTLLFGTLTGVIGSDALPDETAPSAPNVAGQPSAVVATVSTETPDVFSQLLTEVSSLKTAQTTMNTTLQTLVPAPVAITTTTLDVLFYTALAAATEDAQDLALQQIVARSLSYPLHTKAALHAIETSISSNIDNIFSYQSATFWTPPTCVMFAMCVLVNVYLAVLHFLEEDKDSKWRIAIFVPMGGASALAVIVASIAKLITWWNESKTSTILLGIQNTWEATFSNPLEKAFLVKLLSHYWISKKIGWLYKGHSKCPQASF